MQPDVIQAIIDLGKKVENEKELIIRDTIRKEFCRINESLNNQYDWSTLVDKNGLLNALNHLTSIKVVAVFQMLADLIAHKDTVLENEDLVETMTSTLLSRMHDHPMPMNGAEVLNVLSQLSSKYTYKTSMPSTNALLESLFDSLQNPRHKNERQQLALSIVANLAAQDSQLLYPIVSIPLLHTLLLVAKNHDSFSQAEAIRALANLSNQDDTVYLLSKTEGLIEILTECLAPNIANETRDNAYNILINVLQKTILGSKDCILLVSNLLKPQWVKEHHAAEIWAYMIEHVRLETNQVFRSSVLGSLLDHFSREKDTDGQMKRLDKLLAFVLSRESAELIDKKSLLASMTQGKQSENNNKAFSHDFTCDVVLTKLEKSWIFQYSLTLFNSNKNSNKLGEIQPKLGLGIDLIWSLAGEMSASGELKYRAHLVSSSSTVPIGILINILRYPYSQESQLHVLRLMKKIDFNMLVNTKDLLPAVERLVFKLVFNAQDNPDKLMNVTMLEAALSLLSSIVNCNDDLTQQISTPKFFTSLAELIKNKAHNLIIKGHALEILQRCATHQRRRDIIVTECKIVPSLFELSQHNDSNISLQASLALLNLSSKKNQMLLFENAGLVAVFCSLINRTNQNTLIIQRVTTALKELCGERDNNAENNQSVIEKEINLVPLLLNLALNNDNSIAQPALETLVVVAEASIVSRCTPRFLPEIMAFTTNENSKFREYAITILSCVAGNLYDYRSQFYDAVVSDVCRLAEKSIDILNELSVDDDSRNTYDSTLQEVGFLLEFLSYEKNNKVKMLENQKLIDHVQAMYQRDSEHALNTLNELGITPHSGRGKGLKRPRELSRQDESNEPESKRAKSTTDGRGFFSTQECPSPDLNMSTPISEETLKW